MHEITSNTLLGAGKLWKNMKEHIYLYPISHEKYIFEGKGFGVPLSVLPIRSYYDKFDAALCDRDYWSDILRCPGLCIIEKNKPFLVLEEKLLSFGQERLSKPGLGILPYSSSRKSPKGLQLDFITFRISKILLGDITGWIFIERNNGPMQNKSKNKKTIRSNNSMENISYGNFSKLIWKCLGSKILPKING